MNHLKKYCLGALAGVLFATAAAAQAPMSKPKKTELKPAAVASTQEILDSEFALIVLQLKPPLPQNIFRPASACPEGTKWRCDYECIEVGFNGTCIRKIEVYCDCR